jgi:hypothetical protein
VLTSSYDEYLKAQSELLLSIIRIAHELDVEFAIPIQESILPPPDKVLFARRPASQEGVNTR